MSDTKNPTNTPADQTIPPAPATPPKEINDDQLDDVNGGAGDGGTGAQLTAPVLHF